ncbi:hypothetical protein ACLB2K_004407 [Fragaria x ananassa]
MVLGILVLAKLVLLELYIKDHLGSWISGFQINLGIGEILDAEAWGLFYGLPLAAKLNVQRIEIESDSAILVQLLQKNDCGLHPLGTLIAGCLNLITKFNIAKISHIFREGNMVVDALAKDSIKS